MTEKAWDYHCMSWGLYSSLGDRLWTDHCAFFGQLAQVVKPKQPSPLQNDRSKGYTFESRLSLQEGVCKVLDTQEITRVRLIIYGRIWSLQIVGAAPTTLENLKTLARGEVAPKLSFLLCTIS